MKRSILGAFVLVAAVALVASPQAYAACSDPAQPVANGFNSFLGNCKDVNPVQGYIYLLGSTTVNSGVQDVICEAATQSNPSTGQACQAESGIVGDNMVTVLTDWGASNPTIAGCPNTSGIAGTSPIAVHVVCNDGKSALFQVAYADFYTGYLLEMAYPNDNLATAGTGPAPQVRSFAGNIYDIHLTDMDDAADTTAFGKAFYSDCDPNSQSAASGNYTCDPANAQRVPVITRGRVYTKDGPCDVAPDTRLSTGWILPTQTPVDAAGNIQATIDKPATGCRYVGATQNIGIAGGAATETQAVSGAFVLGAAGAQTDKFKIDGASVKGNDVRISFSTENEASLVGFNVYAGNIQLNAGLIPAQGGSKTYTFDTTRGALKGNKAVALEGVFADGTKSKGPAFQVK